MITAFEARQLSEASEKALTDTLAPIYKNIREAATRGERKIYLFPEAISSGYTNFSHGMWVRVKQALTNVGYTLQMGTVVTGGGLGSMDDERGEADVLYVIW